MATLLETLKLRQFEYHEFLEKFIKREDEKFRKLAQTSVAKRNKPIRTAGGKNEAENHNWAWFWGDAIWCGDIHTLAAEEFTGKGFGETEGPDNWTWEEMDEAQTFMCTAFNNALIKHLPEIYWRHIAGEEGATPTTAQERAWMEEGR